MDKKNTFKREKKYSPPDVNELKIEKLKSEWDFEVFGVNIPYAAPGSVCCPNPE